MAELGVQYINPFLMATKSVVEQVCQVQIQVGKPYLKSVNYDAETLLIMIGVTGDVKGQVIMAYPNPVVLTIASKMCMMPMTQIDDMVKSAIGELGNMTMGNAATLLSSSGVGVDITPPTMYTGAMSITNAASQIICIPLSFDGNTFELCIALTK
jgi:chemotaxis protein CheX